MKIRDMFDSDYRSERYEEMLDGMGLQRKQAASHDDTMGMMSMMGIFGVGIAVGAGLGMLFAPKRGQELRNQAISKMPGTRRDLPAQEDIYESAQR